MASRSKRRRRSGHKDKTAPRHRQEGRWSRTDQATRILGLASACVQLIAALHESPVLETLVKLPFNT